LHPETASPSIRSILLVIAGLVVSMALIFAAAALIVGFFNTARQEPGPYQRPPATEIAGGPQAPDLQVAPRSDLAQLDAEQMALLNGYAWVDEQAGIARIPIEQAMDLIARQGLPVHEASQPPSDLAEAGESGMAHPELEERLIPGPGDTALLDELYQAGDIQPPATGLATPAPPAGDQGNIQAGQALFASLGCAACHTGVEGAIGPPLEGLSGSQVPLEDGTEVTADEAYLRESILNPQAHIVAGYQPIMPSFAGRVSEEELAALVAYIQSLGGQQ